VDKIEPAHAVVTVYWFVPSIDEVGKKILDLGGNKVSEKLPEGQHGMFQKFTDPWGVGVALFEAKA
jgi:predicted enzyme related to lactoylglutathione lyase